MGWDEAFADAITKGVPRRLELPPDIDALHSSGRRNYLHLAAGGGRVDAVRWLLEHGATVGGTTAYSTPLHFAAEMGHTEVCAALLDAGAAPSALERGEAGGTPLVLALFYGHASTADFLAQRAVVPDNLRVAGGLGEVRRLEALLGSPAAGRDRAWYRPHADFPDWAPSDDPREILDEALAYAAANGREEATRWLLDRGARADALVYWATAVHLAVHHRHDGVLEMLLATDPDLTIRDTMHEGTPAGWARHVERQDLADRLTP